MKKIIYILLFLLFSSSAFQANSQTSALNLSPVNPDERKITIIKSFESRFVEGKVYLHITVNGNTETNFVAVERSLDATNYEVIGYVKIYGTEVPCNLTYYFTDDSPGTFNLFYRLTDYSISNAPAYSETLGVIPANEIEIPSGINTTTAISNEKSLLVEGSSY